MARNTREQAFLLRLTDALRPLEGPTSVLDTVCALLGEHLQVDGVGYAELESDGEHMTVGRDWTAPGMASVAGRYRLDDFGSFFRSPLEEGRASEITDAARDRRVSPSQYEKAWAGIGVRAAIAYTLSKDRRFVAAIFVHQRQPRTWSAAEVKLVSEVGERTWEAVERARAQAALRESERRYRSLFQTMWQGYAEAELVRDAEGRVVDYRFLTLNPAFERLTGIPVATAIGRTIRELLPDIENAWIEQFRRIVEGGRPQRFEARAASLGRWFEVHAYPGEGDRFVVLYEDITERKAAEAALRESEERFRRVFEIETVGVDFFRTDGAIVDANDAFLSMVGFERSDMLAGRVRWDDLTAPEFRDASLMAFKEFETHGVTTPYEKQYIRPDGSRRWALLAAKQIAKDLGVEFIIDITERKAAEAARSESEARFRTLVDNIPDFAIYRVDPDGIVTDWTEGAARVKGYTAVEVIGRHLSMFYTPEDVADGIPERELHEAKTHGRAELETWKVRKDGERYWSHEITTVLRDAQGRLVGFTRITRDRTESRRVEADRHDQLVRERKGREAAEAFLGVLSHELKTPVTSIYGTASLLARHPERHPERLRELLGDISDESERLVRIVDDLLVLSGVERGLLRLSSEPILPSHVVKEVVSQVGRRYPDIDIEIEGPASVPAVIADATAVRQIVNNLLTNAAKYAGQAGPIRVSLQPSDHTLAIQIDDAGPGLGPDLEALFGLFYRAPHTERLASGTGIGLYVARELAIAMGGTLKAADRNGGGAAFRLTLPTLSDDDVPAVKGAMAS